MSDLISAERKHRPTQAQKIEPAVFGIGGSVLLALAGFFLWKELSVATEVLAVVLYELGLSLKTGGELVDSEA